MEILRFVQDTISKIYTNEDIYKLFGKNKKKRAVIFKEKQKFQYLSLNKISEYQTEKLRNLLRIALKSPYYKKIINSLNIQIDKLNLMDLKKFPILTKDIIRREKNNLLTMPISRLFSNSSGGSTGAPLIFYQDLNYKNNLWATQKLITNICGGYSGARIARLWGAQRDKKIVSTMKGRITFFLQNIRFYDSFNMSEENMWKYHKDMSSFQPDIIVAYASSIYLFAKFLESNKIKPEYPKISISTSAETLYPFMRETIERVFGVKVFDVYGSREVSAIAAECESHSGLHIFMDNVIVECLDPKTGEEVFDKPGEIIITDLNNYGMPFIRYKIGDMGILTKEKCSCGRNTFKFKRIIGRTTDNFIMSDGRIIHGEYFTHLFYGIEGIKEFQFVQESLTNFNLYVVKNEEFSQSEFTKVINEIKEVIGKNSNLNIFFPSSVPKTPTGKYKFTISKVDPKTVWRQQ